MKSIRRITTSAERMARMIADPLDFTRGRLGGGIPLSPQPLHLYPLSRHVVDELEVSHPGRQVRLRAKGELRGEWDPDRLAQLLGNLGTNALDYSPEDTPVDFVLQEEREGVRIEVHNQGPPIPPELLPHIFEPFRRGGEDTTRHSASGLGLGLYISQQIVQAHGGSITVRSTGTEGTTFTVRLPRKSDPSPDSG